MGAHFQLSFPCAFKYCVTSCGGQWYHFNCSVKQYIFNEYIGTEVNQNLASAVNISIFFKSSILADFERKKQSVSVEAKKKKTTDVLL